MNHPNREDWMGFLYEEVGNEEQLRLSAHLQECPSCQRQVAAWRGTMAGLSQWQLNSPPAARRLAPRSWLSWAAAAAVFLVAGITIGASNRPPDLTSLRAALEPSIKASIEKDIQSQWQGLVQKTVAAEREKVMADLRERIERTSAESDDLHKQMADLSRAISVNSARDHEEILTAFSELEAQWVVAHQKLRADLETVAVTTEEGFKKAQTQLVQLASYSGLR
jgi:predicted dinucleotide-binding enzyme